MPETQGLRDVGGDVRFDESALADLFQRVNRTRRKYVGLRRRMQQEPGSAFAWIETLSREIEDALRKPA